RPGRSYWIIREGCDSSPVAIGCAPGIDQRLSFAEEGLRFRVLLCLGILHPSPKIVEGGAGLRGLAESVMGHRAKGNLRRGRPAPPGGVQRGGTAERLQGLLVAADAVQGDAQGLPAGAALGSQPHRGLGPTQRLEVVVAAAVGSPDDPPTD